MAKTAAATRKLAKPELASTNDPQWYKDAVIYQLHVRSFFDSDNDGIGDFIGLTRKLDYLQDLGVTAVWLLPFYPSPLRDDGYDIADYTTVNPVYGNMQDFRAFVKAAHDRGLKVITELVINHTSDQHPWFQKARRAKPGSPARDFYVWSDTPEKYQDARIIFKDYEVSNWSWDPLAKAYYWHRFFSHQPDLNFDNPKVRETVIELLDFWMKTGVDGLRLDAVPYLYEREGSNCENLPETHAYLKALRKHVDEKFPGRMLLAEANQWPEDAIAYFGDGDECHCAFHFPVMPRLYMGLHMEDRFPIVDILQQTPPIPENCQWVMFLRNHDELTLEMVTDEERDYMWRAYAHDRQARINLGIRRRLAPLLDNNRNKIELMNGLLCSLPGTPVIYYGDEIGMGDNIYLGDRHGVRTPMQWSPDRNAGFSDANPQQLYSPVILDSEYLFETINVETQQKNPFSLLWWMKRLISVRGRYPELSRGTFEPLSGDNSKVLSFVRRHGENTMLVVANLSRFPQYVELDLSQFAPSQLIEVFGQNAFPPVTSSPYMLTLSPYAFYWFSVKRDADQPGTSPEPPRLTIDEDWTEVLRGRLKRASEATIAKRLPSRRWFAGKSRAIQSATIQEVIQLGKRRDRPGMALVFTKVEYSEGEPETYVVPLSELWGEAAEQVLSKNPDAVVAYLKRRDAEGNGVLVDAFAEPASAAALLDLMTTRRDVKGTRGELQGWSLPELVKQLGSNGTPVVTGVRAEQSNSSIIYDDKLILKLFRRLDGGVNPELEIGRLLNEKSHDAHVANLYGAVEYQVAREEPVTVGVLQDYYPNTITARQLTLDWIGRFLETAMAQPEEQQPPAVPASERSIWQLAKGDAPQLAKDLLGGFLETAMLIGKRTADLHMALASLDDPRFAPEPCSQFQQRSMYQTARKRVFQTFQAMRKIVKTLPSETQDLARRALDQEKPLIDEFKKLIAERIIAPRIRCHGDLHLGQLLYTGKDFVIIDFEGIPNTTLAARRIKQSPLADVAAMIRSFHYAATQSLADANAKGLTAPHSIDLLRRSLDYWYVWTSSAYLKSYLTNIAPANILPSDDSQGELLLHFHLLEKAVTELNYELNHRPEDVVTPLTGILELLGM